LVVGSVPGVVEFAIVCWLVRLKALNQTHLVRVAYSPRLLGTYIRGKCRMAPSTSPPSNSQDGPRPHGGRSHEGRRLQPSPYRKTGYIPHPNRPLRFDLKQERVRRAKHPAWPSLPPPTTNSEYADESQGLRPEASRGRAFLASRFSSSYALSHISSILYPQISSEG